MDALRPHEARLPPGKDRIMMNSPASISGTYKTASCFLKAVVILSAVVGTMISALAGSRSFMGGRVVFMYFTIQSNLAIALICAVGAVLMLKNRPIGKTWYVIKLVGTVAITLTGVVFCFVLAPVMGKAAWNLQNLLTHVVVPVFSIADFFVAGIFGEIRKRCVFFVLLPPLAYAVYAGVGYVRGWNFGGGMRYPYFFLNWGSPAGAVGFSGELPFMGCVWWIIVLMVFLLLIGYLYLSILYALQKRALKRSSHGIHG